MWVSLLYGVLINYGFAQLIWFGMARTLPPATSAMSIMAIPLVGTLERHLDRGRGAPLARLAGHGLCDDGHRQRVVAHPSRTATEHGTIDPCLTHLPLKHPPDCT